MLRLSLLRVCASSARPMVVLCSRYFVACPPKVVLPALLFPLFLVSTLPHAFKLRNQVVEARCFVSSSSPNPRRRVQSTQLNSGELDVTLMRSSDCGDGLQSWAWSRGNKEHQSLSTKPPYNIHCVGDERSLARRVHVPSSRSEQECTTTVISTRM